jgi:hypothetical protein
MEAAEKGTEAGGVWIQAAASTSAAAAMVEADSACKGDGHVDSWGAGGAEARTRIPAWRCP